MIVETGRSGVAEDMPTVDLLWGHALCMGGAHVVLVLESSTEARVTREMIASGIEPRAMAGQDQVLCRVPGGSPVPGDDAVEDVETPSGGSASNHTSWRRRSDAIRVSLRRRTFNMIARKNTGIEIPISDKNRLP